MEVILNQDVKGLGYKNDIITVKPGYARNYLIPKDLAILGNKSNKKIVEENIRQAAHKAEKTKKDAMDLAEKMGNLKVTVTTKAGEKDKIFGSITLIQISEALQKLGYVIDRRKITIEDKIKILGEYKITLDLHKEVRHTLLLSVERE